MAENPLDRIAPGMDVYDATGQRIGTVEAIYHEILPETNGNNGAVPPFEEGIEIKTEKFLGLGGYLSVPLDTIVRIDGNSIFLGVSLAELEAEERERFDPDADDEL